MGAYMYPGLLAVFMFLGTLMISALIGLAMISVEGRALYIIKSLPVHNLDVLKGKSLALLIIGFPIIIPMAFLLPIVAGFPLQVTIFYFLLSLVFVTSFTGIGIWGGTRFPNFDPTARNMPDIMSQFLIMSVCIICTLFIGGIPAFLMMQNNIIGLVAIIVALGWAVTIFIIALNRGQVGYEQIGSDMYM
jgi:ABC-2 type transport system permease protein